MARFMALSSTRFLVSIPKRVSEVLWPKRPFYYTAGDGVSIPKRVSEVLWLYRVRLSERFSYVSIPKRVSEVLWPCELAGRVRVITRFNP